jgi:hypothetical protein
MVLVAIFSDLDSRCLKGVVLFSGRLLYTVAAVQLYTVYVVPSPRHPNGAACSATPGGLGGRVEQLDQAVKLGL